MFIEGQDLVKKELVKHFLAKDFAYIDDIFPEEEEDEYEEEHTEDNPFDQVSAKSVMDIGDKNIIKTQKEETEDVAL